MKHRPKNRPHLKKSKQRLFDELEKAERTMEAFHPIYDPNSRQEPSVERMLDAGEGNLSDR
jgi:hypothetical protein